MSRLEAGNIQALKAGRSARWSFDSSLLPQYALHKRPGIIERRSIDGAVAGKAAADAATRPSYASLMADYRARLGMGSSWSGTPTSRKSYEQPSVRLYSCF